MDNYDSRRDFGDSCLTQVKTIIGNGFKVKPDAIRTSSLFEDTQRATDLVLPNGVTVAMRLRTYEYRRYMGQFTVRTSGRITELEKLQGGMVHYVFYGFTDEAGKLSEWFLMRNTPELLRFPIEEKTNGVDSYFTAYRINPACVVGCWRGVPIEHHVASNN